MHGFVLEKKLSCTSGINEKFQNFLDFLGRVSHKYNGKFTLFTLNLYDAQVFEIKNSEINCQYKN